MCVEPMIMHGANSPSPVNVCFKIMEHSNCEQQGIPGSGEYIFMLVRGSIFLCDPFMDYYAFNLFDILS